MKNIWIIGGLLGSIFLFAFFVRIYDISNIPPGIYPDEAVNGADALYAREHNDYKLFYENNFGREGLYINLQALSIQLFGYNELGLRFWSIFFGALTVVGMYFLAWEIWRKPWVSLVGAYLVAVSYWSINFSRIAFRAIMMLPIILFSFYFLLRGLRTKSHWSFLASGLIFGLGLHTYIAFRLAPAILVAFLIGLLISYRSFLKLYWKFGMTFVVGVLISAAPMFWDFYVNPHHFVSRSSEISIMSEEVNGGDLWGTLGETVGLSLIKYTFYGDQNWRHNYAPTPILDPISGSLFFIGFFGIIFASLYLLYQRIRLGKRDRMLAVYFLLGGWFVVMLAPEFLTNEGLPHALRAIGTLPVVFLIALIPIVWVGEKVLHTQNTLARHFAIGILIFALGVAGSINIHRYFVLFPNTVEAHRAFDEKAKNIAHYLLSLPDNENKYFFTNAGGILEQNNLPIAAQPVAFLTHKQLKNITSITQENRDDVEITAPSRIVLLEYDEAFVQRVKVLYPGARIETIDMRPGFESHFEVIVIE